MLSECRSMASSRTEIKSLGFKMQHLLLTETEHVKMWIHLEQTLEQLMRKCMLINDKHKCTNDIKTFG